MTASYTLLSLNVWCKLCCQQHLCGRECSIYWRQ